MVYPAEYTDASRDLCQQSEYTFTFLSDPKADLIRRYDLVYAGAGIDGQDFARPAEFLVDLSGTVRWVNCDVVVDIPEPDLGFSSQVYFNHVLIRPCISCP